jgi:rare lipoprotein A (peptidoglycan hydrolase)
VSTGTIGRAGFGSGGHKEAFMDKTDRRNAAMTVKLASAYLLFAAFVLPLAAQNQNREEGIAFCYFEEGNDFLYATHSRYPFGTQLVITNPINQAHITVKVGGRPDPGRNALVEISEQAARQLGMDIYSPIWIWVTPVPVEEDKPHVQRPMTGMFRQSGDAVVLGTMTGFVVSHPSLPIGTKIKVTNLIDGRNVTLTVNNRIPASVNRIIEISPAVAQTLGIRNASAPVRIESVVN